VRGKIPRLSRVVMVIVALTMVMSLMFGVACGGGEVTTVVPLPDRITALETFRDDLLTNEIPTYLTIGALVDYAKKVDLQEYLKEASIDDLEDVIDALETLMGNVTERLDALEGIGPTPSDLEDAITDLEDLIATLEVWKENATERIDDLEDTIIDLTERLDALESATPTPTPIPGGLTLTVIGELPNITTGETNYTVEVYIHNGSVTPGSGRVVLQLSAQSGTVTFTGGITFLGEDLEALAFPGPYTYEPSDIFCNKIICVSEPVVLAGGYGVTKRFTVRLVGQAPDPFWWIASLQMVD